MSARAGQRSEEAALVRIAGWFIVVVIAATLLDRAPWVLPWAIAAGLLVKISARVAARRRRVIGRRDVYRPAAAGLLMAIIVWGGFGLALNRDARQQLRARPPAAVAAYVRQRVPHSQPRTPPQRRRAQRRQQTLMRSPAARLYGVAQLGRWHWPRLIAGDSALLGGPLALWGIAIGLALTRRRQQRAPTSQPPGSSLPAIGQAGLRTAGRGR